MWKLSSYLLLVQTLTTKAQQGEWRHDKVPLGA